MDSGKESKNVLETEGGIGGLGETSIIVDASVTTIT